MEFKSFAARLALGLAICLAAALPARGQFDAFGPPGSPLPGLAGAAAPSVVNVSAEFTAPSAEKPAYLFITADIQPDWHIYSITQPTGGPLPTEIKLDASADYRLKEGFRPQTPPEKKVEPLFGDNFVVESHHGEVTWFAPIELTAGVDPATLTISGSVSAQPCDPNTCLPPQKFKFSATLGKGTAVPVVNPAAAPGSLVSPVATVKKPVFDPKSLRVAAIEENHQMPFALIIGMGFIGGLILNLMPCVLPVIGLKVLSFVEQAHHSRRHALMLNIWYALGLLAVFWVLAGLAIVLGYGWGQLFTHKEFNIALAAVVFAMGLSFLGIWEIPIPGFVGRGKLVEAAEHEGVAGAFTKGVLTTLLATPCSAPFLGPAITWAIVQPPAVTFAVFTSIGLGMASPYLVIGAYPELLRFLPKPGAWMETFKQIMGFVLMGTVAFLLTFIPIELGVPTVVFLFGLWAACWWIGRLPATADSETKFRQWLGAAAFAVLSWAIAFPGIAPLYNGRYSFDGVAGIMGRYFDQAVDQRLADRAIEAAEAAPKPNETAELPWQAFTRSIFEQHVAAGRTVLIDFTANWCLTCKTLEATVLNTVAVRNTVDANKVVTLRADWTHGDPQVTEMLSLLGAKQVPVVAIFPAERPNEPIVFASGGYTQRSLLNALEQAGPSRDAAPVQTASAR